MALRFKVARLWVVHKRQRFNEGDLLPEEFTERDRVRNIYARRIEQVEVPDEELNPTPDQDQIPPEDINPTPPVVNTPPQVPTTPAEVKPTVVKTTGAATPAVKATPAKPTANK